MIDQFFAVYDLRLYYIDDDDGIDLYVFKIDKILY